MEILLIVIGALLLMLGLVGCVLPVLPGPPLSFAGILLLWWAQDWQAETFGVVGIVVMGAAAIVVTIIDNLAPVLGAKKYGASRLGFWMSVVGMLVGLVFFPPFGLILGALIGAITGELLSGREDEQALRAAWGVFVGTMLGIALKLVVSLAITGYFVAELL